PLFESRLARKRERPLVALAHLRRLDPLLQAVVAGDEQLLDPLPHVIRHLRPVTALERTADSTTLVSVYLYELAPSESSDCRRPPSLQPGARGHSLARRADRGGRHREGRAAGDRPRPRAAARRRADGHQHAG